jgi:hypothetical protein
MGRTLFGHAETSDDGFNVVRESKSKTPSVDFNRQRGNCLLPATALP